MNVILSFRTPFFPAISPKNRTAFGALLLTVSLCCLWTLSSGCSTCCSHKSSGSSVTSFDDYTNYFRSWKSNSGLRVYACDGSRVGSNTDITLLNMSQPPVLILHELPGMTPQCLSLATNIAANGYTVYLPLLFGRPGSKSTDWDNVRNTLQLWINHNWCIFHKEKTPPIAKKIRAITSEIAERESGKPMGIIGMCLTGTYPLLLLTSADVRFIVISQPALPLLKYTKGQKKALGISPEDLEIAKTQVKEKAIGILGLRFCNDTISVSNKMNNLREQFEPNFSDGTIQAQELKTSQSCRLHSVLCEQYDNSPESPTRKRFDEMISDFKQRLATH